MKTISLDYNATTPIDSEVLKAMLPFLKKHFGNPSSSHILGKIAKEEVEKARGRIAILLGCEPEEIVFTSGGSEANNMALKGVAETLASKGNHIITSQIEHPADRLPNTLNLSFEGIDSEELLSKMEGMALGTVRISFGKYNSEAEVKYAVDELVKRVKELGK